MPGSRSATRSIRPMLRCPSPLRACATGQASRAGSDLCLSRSRAKGFSRTTCERTAPRGCEPAFVPCASGWLIARFTDTQHLPRETHLLVREERCSAACRFYLSHLSADTTLEQLAATMKAHWICKQAYEPRKEDFGFDHFSAADGMGCIDTRR